MLETPKTVDEEKPCTSKNLKHVEKTISEFDKKPPKTTAKQEKDTSIESPINAIQIEDVAMDLKQPTQKAKESESESETQPIDVTKVTINYTSFQHESQLMEIMKLIEAELSEPYSIYTYRYFIYTWPHLCLLAEHEERVIGAIVCKQEEHHGVQRGYIAMLAVHKNYRKHRIGTTLVEKAIEVMLANKADEVVLETEMTNVAALSLYENLGFVRSKRLFRYYLNGVDAFCLKLWFK